MTIAACGHCPWEVDFPTDTAAHEGLDRHVALRHADAPPDTDDLCRDLVARHTDEWDLIVYAIETWARRNGGRVDANSIRSLLPKGVTPQMPGAVFNVLRQQGRLRKVDTTVNTDTAGRNNGKPLTVYQLIEQPAVSR